jgi:membrane dipeptidase
MNTSALHDDLVVVDGLIISKWSRDVFADMRRGGLTAANCSCLVWEDFRGAMDNIAEWKTWFRVHDDLILQVHTTADIRRAKAEGKIGIFLGWQNTSGIEDRIGYLELFKALGVGVMQLTYNTQNLSGCGCYESRDGGLSDFGRDVVDEMNRVGIVCDLSHVGAQTSTDVIRHSKKPVAFTHCLPAGLKAHPRNKTDEQLKLIVDHGGFVGVTMYPWFLPRGNQSTIDDYVTAIDYILDRVGEEQVGIGTDFTQDQGRGFLEWLARDKGDGRFVFEVGDEVFPDGLRAIGDMPNLTLSMERRGWSENRIRNVMGENWIRFLANVWGE